MSKYFKISFDIFFKHMPLYLLIVAQLFITFLFSVDSVNYISHELYVVNFAKPLSDTNFICYMPFSDFLYPTSDDNNSQPCDSKISDCYSRLTGLEDISKECSFGVSEFSNVFEVRAISRNILDNLNLKVKKGTTLKNATSVCGTINCLTSDTSKKIGDIITVKLHESYKSDTDMSLNFRVVGILAEPYFYMHTTSAGTEQGFFNVFKFNSAEETNYYECEIIWTDYNEISNFIIDNELDNSKASPVYKEFLFFNEEITDEQFAANERILNESGTTFSGKTAYDYVAIKAFFMTEAPTLICVGGLAIIGFALMTALSVYLSKEDFKIIYICGADKKQIILIQIISSVTMLLFSNIFIFLLMALSYFINIFEWELYFIKYNLLFIGILNIILLATITIVSYIAAKRNTYTVAR